MKGGTQKMECTSYGCSNGSCTISFEQRRFFTRAEKIEMLKEHQKYLEQETQGVIEKIKEIESE